MNGVRDNRRMRLGFTTWGMVTVRAEEAIPLLASIGYDSVEIAVVPGWRDSVDLLTPTRRRRIKQLLGEYDVALAAIAGNSDLLATDADELAESWQVLTSTVDLAVEWASRDGPPAVDPSGAVPCPSLTVGETVAYLSDPTRGTVVRIDLATGTPAGAPIQVGGTPSLLTLVTMEGARH